MSDHDPVIVSFQFESAEKSLDVNGDEVIDFNDYYAIYFTVGAVEGDAAFNSAADMDSDGTITFTDMNIWYQGYLDL